MEVKDSYAGLAAMYTGPAANRIQHGDSSQRNLKIEIPTLPLLDTYLKNFKSTYHRDSCTSMFITVLFIIEDMEFGCYPSIRLVEKKIL